MDKVCQSDLLIVGALQGTAFFVSVYLVGFVIGHEAVIRHFLPLERGFQKSKPAWQQPECYSAAKRKSMDYFPLFWYWGNIRSGMLFWLPAFLLGSEAQFPAAAFMAATLIVAANLALFYFSKQRRWDETGETER